MASWELHKYYRGLCLPMIKSRLNHLKACSFRLTNIQTHQLIKWLTNTETTAKFDNKQYLEFLEQVWCIGAHIGVTIPDPNEPTEMQKIKELSDVLKAVYTTLRPFISSPVTFFINEHTNLVCTDNSARLFGYSFTDFHIEVTVYASTKEPTTLVTVVPEFNDRHLYKITHDLLEVFKKEIEPICNKDNRLSTINTRIGILQNEKEAIENEN